MRVLLFVLALVAMPLAVGAAQGSSGGNANANAVNRCNNSPQAGKNAASLGGAAQAAEAQLHKNCAPAGGGVGDPPPSSDPPPSGIHAVAGFVYEDIDGSGRQDMFAGELGLAGWTVELYWNGQLVASKASNGDGWFSFDNLGNSTWIVCVIPQAGYIRTQPANETACGGNGYGEFPLNGPFATEFAAMFGFMLPPQ